MENNRRVREKYHYKKGAFAYARSQRRENRRTAGARLVSGGGTGCGRDRERKHQQAPAGPGRVRAGKLDALDEQGRKIGPKHDVDQSSRLSSIQHAKDMQSAGVTSGWYIHRHKNTGRCILREVAKPEPMHAVIGRVPHAAEWIPLVLRSEAKKGRLNCTLEELVRSAWVLTLSNISVHAVVMVRVRRV